MGLSEEAVNKLRSMFCAERSLYKFGIVDINLLFRSVNSQAGSKRLLRPTRFDSLDVQVSYYLTMLPDLSRNVSYKLCRRDMICAREWTSVFWSMSLLSLHPIY